MNTNTTTGTVTGTVSGTLAGTKILLGITGGIAAYKAAEIARLLMQKGCTVRAVMTEGAQNFITPLTLQALTGQPTHHALMDEDSEASMDHISLARWADQILIAPATAHFIAKLTHGLADDLLSTLCLAATADITIAPAMNHVMWTHVATQANVSTLQSRGVRILGPEYGEQACGETGPGRLMTPEKLVDNFVDNLVTDAKLPQPTQTINNVPQTDKTDHWIITAGPTQEAIDPVRFISNRSSGKMGFALAAAAAAQGKHVTLIAGPSSLPTPEGVTQRIDVQSAQDMLAACEAAISARTEAFISAAAVGDYRCETIPSQKIKKDGDTLSLTLVKNPDIVQTIAQRIIDRPRLVIGFAAETQAVEDYARKKLLQKGLDLIIANDVSRSDIGFDSDYNQIQVISKSNSFTLGPAPKTSLGVSIFDAINRLLV